MGDWKIKRKEDGCVRCERAFEEDERHFSILLFDAETLGREDRCVPCFEGDEELPTDLVFWKTQRRARSRHGISVDFDSVERLFLALDGRPEERLIELRYLLSLLLMRKKRLRLVRVKRLEGGGEWMVLRRPRRTEALEVQVFDLTPERAGELRAELARIVEGAGGEDLDAILEAAPAPAAAAPEGEGEAPAGGATPPAGTPAG
jgi:hypothetical protein